MKGVLVSAEGYVFRGVLVGDISSPVSGELCFNTSMMGYQEIISDPSYTSQIIVFTFPHVGNVGFNKEDIESDFYINNKQKKAIVFRELPTFDSNWRSLGHFSDWLQKYGILGLYDIDTRDLTEKIRMGQVSNAIISNYETEEDIINLYKTAKNMPSMKGMDLASGATRKNVSYWQNFGWRESLEPCVGLKTLAVIDFGLKENILRLLEQEGFDITVFPCTLASFDLVSGFDAVFLSNGPGDPCATLNNLPEIRSIVLKCVEIGKPLFGICLGHQLISSSLGCRVEKLPQGHRGANHPVLDCVSGRVEICAQNHGFAALKQGLPSGISVSHYSLFDGVVEGIEVQNKPVLSVQYHPESSSGPHDSRYLFKKFRQMVLENNS